MVLKTLLSVLLLATSAVAGAQERNMTGSAESGYAPWQTVSADMSPDEYRQAYRGNRRFLRHVLESYATAALVSLGISEQGLGVLGATAALVLDQNAALSLNQNRTLAVQFSDMVKEERAVQVGYTLRW